jgi:SSS family solute:Na+ symporter
MTGLGGNVSAFASLWTQEIYRSSLRPNESESHYILVGRCASVTCLALSLGAAFATLYFESLSEFMLLIFSITLIPFFAVVIAGIASRRGSASGAMTGAMTGMAGGITAQLGYRAGWLPAGSQLNANLHAAIISFTTALAGYSAGSWLFRGSRSADWSTGESLLRSLPAPSRSLYALAVLLLGCCVLLNVLWR